VTAAEFPHSCLRKESENPRYVTLHIDSRITRARENQFVCNHTKHHFFVSKQSTYNFFFCNMCACCCRQKFFFLGKILFLYFFWQNFVFIIQICFFVFHTHTDIAHPHSRGFESLRTYYKHTYTHTHTNLFANLQGALVRAQTWILHFTTAILLQFTTAMYVCMNVWIYLLRLLIQTRRLYLTIS
jgi:hypothetical protein